MLDLKILKVFDSRGNFTIQAILIDKNLVISGFAPAGKSTGKHEVITYPLKNGNPNIDLAFNFFKKHKKSILDAFKLEKQEEFDNFLKEISNNLVDMGGSLSVALSILFLRFKAYQNNKLVYEFLLNGKKPSFPKPLGNVIGGGLHSNNKMSVQEILITHNDNNVSENIKKNIDVYHEIAKQLKKENIYFCKNDENAIASNLTFEKSLKLLESAKEKLGYDTKIGFDFAANDFYKDGKYLFEGKKYNVDEFIDYILNLFKQYKNIVFLEDPFNEEKFEDFAKLQKQTNVLICGDDLYTTNTKRISKGIANKSTNAVLIKPNQIGTISDTLKAIKLAKENDMKTVISHRSGETCDPIIAHLAVGKHLDYIKTGTIGGERLAKLNELMFIEKLVR